MVSSPESLTKEHDLRQFECGNELLTDWLKKYALQSQQSGHSKTMVVTEGEQRVVVGYYSYNVCSVEHADSIPARVRKGLAKHPIPIFLIARLARDVKFRGTALGKRLLRHALNRASAISEAVPIRAIVVDAIEDKARSFYSEFDFESFPADSLRMWLLMKDLQKTISSSQKE